MILNLLLIFFSTLLMLSSIMVIVSYNAIYSILFLILSFLTSTSILFLLEFEFISLLFIIIYVGAIAILFLFVIMMVNTDTINNRKKNILKYFFFSIFIGFIFLLNIILMIFNTYKLNSYSNNFLYNFYTNWFDKLDSLTEVESIGQVLYTYYVLQFLISGLILLLAVICAVSLTINKYSWNYKNQILFKQLSRNYKNALWHY